MDRLSTLEVAVDDLGKSLLELTNKFDAALQGNTDSYEEMRGDPTPPPTTGESQRQWMFKLRKLRFWGKAIDDMLTDLTTLNVVGAENMDAEEILQLLLDTSQPRHITQFKDLSKSGPNETWFCFKGVCTGDHIEMEEDSCPIHSDCVLVKRTFFVNEQRRMGLGLKFRKVH